MAIAFFRKHEQTMPWNRAETRGMHRTHVQTSVRAGSVVLAFGTAILLGLIAVSLVGD
jgi:hypothetical protein